MLVKKIHCNEQIVIANRLKIAPYDLTESSEKKYYTKANLTIRIYVTATLSALYMIKKNGKIYTGFIIKMSFLYVKI